MQEEEEDERERERERERGGVKRFQIIINSLSALVKPCILHFNCGSFFAFLKIAPAAVFRNASMPSQPITGRESDLRYSNI